MSAKIQRPVCREPKHCIRREQMGKTPPNNADSHRLLQAALSDSFTKIPIRYYFKLKTINSKYGFPLPASYFLSRTISTLRFLLKSSSVLSG